MQHGPKKPKPPSKARPCEGCQSKLVNPKRCVDCTGTRPTMEQRAEDIAALVAQRDSLAGILDVALMALQQVTGRTPEELRQMLEAVAGDTHPAIRTRALVSAPGNTLPA